MQTTVWKPSKGQKFRSAYDGVPCKVDLDCSKFDNGDECVSRTKQSFKDQCDIHKVIRTYDKTGLITHVNNAVKRYGDYSEVNEFKENLEMVNAAKDAFAELPSDIRKKFKSDPGAFFEFATDPKNIDEMVELGLAERKVAGATLNDVIAAITPVAEKIQASETPPA